MRTLTSAGVLVALTVLPALALWDPVPEPGGSGDIEALAAGDDALYAGDIMGLVYRSEDHGDSWALVSPGLSEGDYAPVSGLLQAGDWLIVTRDIVSDPNYRSRRVAGVWQAWEPMAYQGEVLHNLRAMGETLYASLSGQPRRSEDLGDTWTPLAQPPGAVVRRVIPAGPFLIGFEDEINSGEIFRSADGGQSWAPITGSLGSSFPCGLTVFGGELILSLYHYGGAGSLWRSPDWGDNWQQVTNLPTGDTNLNGLAVEGSLLALGASGSTEGGSVILTSDFVDYLPYTGDLPPFAQPVNELIAQDGWLFKSGGTVTRYRALLPELTAAGQEPAATSRLSVHPNPFNPRTTFSFSLAAPGSLSLEVFDLAGRLVARPFEGTLPAGRQTIVWDAREAAGEPLPAGVYFARLAGDAGGSSAKLVILK